MISFIKKFLKKRKHHDVVKLLSPGNLFFDIGAHLGDKSKQFLDKKLIAVMLEPLPECVEKLKLKFKNENNIQIIQKAVGKKVGNVLLEVNSKMPTTSTMAEHWKKGRFSNEKWDKKILVDVTTLDILIKNHGLPNYIKIDVEGFELDILNGFGILIKNIKLIQFEFGGANIDTRTYFQDFWYFFQDKDFSLFRINPRGVTKILNYSEDLECFLTTNFIALNNNL